MKYYSILFLSMLFLLSCSENEPGSSQEGTDVNPDIDVFFAQTHVQAPSTALFKLIGNRAALIKVHVTSPSGDKAPSVKAILTLGGNSTTLALKGPATLPQSINIEPGKVKHAHSNSFTGTIPKDWIKPGLSVEVLVGSKSYRYDNLKIGAPNKVIMTMFDVSYFKYTAGDYPTGWKEELAAKFPVSEIELRRLNGIVFPEVTIPPRGNYIAARVRSREEYTALTGSSFDGEQAAATQWNSALRMAAGTRGRVSLFYTNIYGVAAGGVAGGFSGVGNGKEVGILTHELGHALSLPHWGDNASYPYKGDMHGIPAPDVYRGVHVGPTWAYDLPRNRFIPPTVQANSVGGTVGTYKKDPMQGGGQGDQEEGFLIRHFSDYSVSKMQAYMEGHIVVWNPNLNSYASWDDTKKSYARLQGNNGVLYAHTRDAEVISVMAGVSAVTPQATILYPPIGPYKSGLINVFDPRNATDRTNADNIYCPTGGCDVSLRIVQGGKTKILMLPIEMNASADPLNLNSFQTRAINLKASEGEVTKIELLRTPDAEKNGLPSNPTVLRTWSK